MRPVVSAVRAARLCGRCRRHQISTSPASALTRPTTTTSSTAVSSSSSPYSWPTQHQAQPFSHTTPSRQDASATAKSPPSAASLPRTLYDFFPETLPDGPPPSGHFPIDTRSLRREFLRLQARAHPDMHPAESKAKAEATSAAINEAYKTLSNPLLRAQYLLSLQGVDVANDETLKAEDPELLMVVLEAHETIEDASGPEDLQALTTENEARIADSENVLEEAFHKDDVDTAKTEAVRLRYWVNIRQAVHDWEEGKPAVLQH